ncbi:MAG: hydrogen gas-evolving membrane-bound hydrogenase subunit E [Candidatus Thiodiazotropha sp.]
MNGVFTWLPDLLLVTMLIGLGWATVSSTDLKRAVALFIAFGLLLSVAWARLRAPDLALAEAALGAGLSGALLLAALRDEPSAGDIRKDLPFWQRSLVDLLTVALALPLAWVLWSVLSEPAPSPLAERALSALDRSGVSNPVTAVLLNYRAYDTLLELVVVLAAVLGVVSLGRERPGYRQAGPVLSSLVRWLVPLLILAAGYLLWVGAHAPGGAFQAGATLAAASVMLRLSGADRAGLPVGLALRASLSAGVGLFLLVGLGLMGAGQGFLHYPPAWSGGLILLIESAATLAIAAALGLAYLGGRPAGWEAGDPDPSHKERRP